MRILYGVCGDGMGHAMRSAVLARHLQSAGHELTFVSHDGALSYLRKKTDFPTIGVVGMNSHITRNRVSPLGTLLTNIVTLYDGAPANMLSTIEMAAKMPDVVITDFEPTTAHYALAMRKPLIAVDNVHFLNHCKHSPELINGDYSAARLMYEVCETLIPSAHRYLVTTFAGAPVCRPLTSLHLPILREKILEAKTGVSEGSHIVAYFNSKADHRELAAVFRNSEIPVRLYGKDSQKREQTDGNLTLCPFSDESFIQDVATSFAVIGGSGFTFMTEAIFFGKPMFALPYEMQFEQILNANYLAALGYGERCRQLTNDTLRTFLDNVPTYAEKLKGFRHDGNQGLFESVDRALKEVA
jgi:uncharacterized protein (TIGR00661 family)